MQNASAWYMYWSIHSLRRVHVWQHFALCFLRSRASNLHSVLWCRIYTFYTWWKSSDILPIKGYSLFTLYCQSFIPCFLLGTPLEVVTVGSKVSRLLYPYTPTLSSQSLLKFSTLSPQLVLLSPLTNHYFNSNQGVMIHTYFNTTGRYKH